MNKTIVDNINSCVGEDDELYHLGDWSFGGKESVWIFKQQLKCKNIHLIYGNHDQWIERNYENIQDTFKSISYYKEIKVNHNHFILSHYAMRVWNKSHKGSIMLYGHSHGTLDALKPEFTSPTWIGDEYFVKNFKTMDVGMDANPNFKPYSITEILEIMNSKEILLNIDHHSEKTN